MFLEHSVCCIFTGGVSRKNNLDEIARVFIQVKIWLKNILSQSEGGGRGQERGMSEYRNRLWRTATPQGISPGILHTM